MCTICFLLRSGYSYKVAVALSLFLGWLGADRFYLGYPALGKSPYYSNLNSQVKSTLDTPGKGEGLLDACHI